jgi:hypothetical protein
MARSSANGPTGAALQKKPLVAYTNPSQTPSQCYSEMGELSGRQTKRVQGTAATYRGCCSGLRHTGMGALSAPAETVARGLDRAAGCYPEVERQRAVGGPAGCQGVRHRLHDDRHTPSHLLSLELHYVDATCGRRHARLRDARARGFLTQKRHSYSGHFGLVLATKPPLPPGDRCGASTDALLFGFGFTGGQ